MTANHNKKTGFTLIELLFAIFIFTIVISSVYGAYRTTFHTIRGAETILNESHNARTALARITDDLSSIVTGAGGFLQGTGQDTSGTSSLSFIASTHISLREDDKDSGNTVIQYSSELDEKHGTINLMRSDRIKRPDAGITNEDAAKFLLCSGLKEIRFTYFNRTGEETTEWNMENGTQDNENPVPELPVMIAVELVFPGQDTSTNGNVFKTAVAVSGKVEE